MQALPLIAIAKIMLLEILNEAGGELDALTLFTRAIDRTGGRLEPMTLFVDVELEPTDIIKITPRGLINLKQALGGE